MDIALMIEGQDGLNWERWKAIGALAEEVGFGGLFRSDHITNPHPPEKDSLELWASLTWLAANTQRIHFGPLVTPMSFRHPVNTARIAKDVDALSGGRLVLGLGAGWLEREHEMFGFPLLSMGRRMDRFEEGVEVVHRLLRSDDRVSFTGDFYQLQDAILLPPPVYAGSPSIAIGGTGWNRTLPLAARFADEWNGVLIGPEGFRKHNQRLTDLLQKEGRDPNSVRRSLMTNVLFGRDEAELKRRAKARGRSLGELRRGSGVVGTASEVVDQLGEYEAAGVEWIMLQWLETDELEGLQAMAESVIPAFHNE